MSNPSTSKDLSSKGQLSHSTSTRPSNTVEVAVSSRGQRLNLSVECLSTPEQRPRLRKFLLRRSPRHSMSESFSRNSESLANDIRPLRPHVRKGKSSTPALGSISPSTPCAGSSNKSNSPKSAKHNRIRQKLRNCVLESDPNELRQQLRAEQDKNLVLEQKVQLKAAEARCLKRREQEYRRKEKNLFQQLRNANDHLKDAEEQRDTNKQQYRNSKRDLRISKQGNDAMQKEIVALRLRVDTLNGSQHASSKNNNDGPKPSTSGTAATKQTKSENDGNIFEDMMDNFKNMLENQLQCSICSEVSRYIIKKYFGGACIY